MEAKYTEIGIVQDFFTVLYVFDSQVNKCTESLSVNGRIRAITYY